MFDPETDLVFTGGFGKIFRAAWNGVQVALKTLILTENKDIPPDERARAFDEFKHEVYLMRCLFSIRDFFEC